MNDLQRFAVVFTLSLFSGAAAAATEEISSTNHNVTTRVAEKVTLPDGRSIMTNAEVHGTSINDSTGEISSTWCRSDQYLDAKGSIVRTSGACTVFYDSGDTLEYAFGGTTMDQPGTWTVVGGTGRYAGATGGGTFSVLSQRADGFAWTNKGIGKITTR